MHRGWETGLAQLPGGGNLIKWKVAAGRDSGGGVVAAGAWNMTPGVLRVT